jgi:hypothetical protein
MATLKMGAEKDVLKRILEPDYRESGAKAQSFP